MQTMYLSLSPAINSLAYSRFAPVLYWRLTMKLEVIWTVTLLLLGFVAESNAQTQLKWFGQAAFAITTPKGKLLLIDPWLSNPVNPEAKDGKDPLASISKVDYILLTHGHRDHVGEAVQIANKTGAILIANPELAANLVKLSDFPPKQAQTDAIMGIGGEIRIADGEVTVAMTPAVHSSSVFNPKAGPNEPERAYGGNPAGFVIMIQNGPTLYHSGDTAYFTDMETLGEMYSIDVALLNIGGHFGMEPRMAAKAAASVRCRIAIPHHFGTSPGIAQNSSLFAAELKKLRIPMYEMKPGETVAFKVREIVRGK
jgi:L-ascorbate metabolism protein UlaG (beta-lactamase superfamily)